MLSFSINSALGCRQFVCARWCASFMPFSITLTHAPEMLNAYTRFAYIKHRRLSKWKPTNYHVQLMRQLPAARNETRCTSKKCSQFPEAFFAVSFVVVAFFPRCVTWRAQSYTPTLLADDDGSKVGEHSLAFNLFVWVLLVSFFVLWFKLKSCENFPII